jgi:sec-independent protein translocase protein TatB
MFDIGFSEMLVIALVALIVIGPERLPKVARTLGHLFGRMQRYVNDVKADINREIQLDELKDLQKSVEDSARAIEQTVSREISTTESEFKEAGESIAALGTGEPAAMAAEPAASAAPSPAGPKGA